MDRMRPMSEAPRDGTEVLLWWKEATYNPDVAHYYAPWTMWLTDGDSAYQDAVFAGWTPIVRPLEPDAPERNCKGAWVLGNNCKTCPRCIETKPEAPEPEAQTMPPTPQRLRLQIRSAARESVALGQGVGEFLAMAEMAHAQATQRAARVGR